MSAYGYARVSSRDQNLHRQLNVLDALDLDRVFCDKASGRDFERPEYKKLMRKLRAGDTVYVSSLDRLGRNYDEVRGEWRRITSEKQADIVVLDMPVLDTRSKDCGLTGRFIADMVLDVLAYVAAMERENIHERQRQGIEAAKARGVRFGRPKIEKPDNWEAVKRGYLRREIRRVDAAEMVGVSKTTFDTWVRNDLEEEGW